MRKNFLYTLNIPIVRWQHLCAWLKNLNFNSIFLRSARFSVQSNRKTKSSIFARCRAISTINIFPHRSRCWKDLFLFCTVLPVLPIPSHRLKSCSIVNWSDRTITTRIVRCWATKTAHIRMYFRSTRSHPTANCFKAHPTTEVTTSWLTICRRILRDVVARPVLSDLGRHLLRRSAWNSSSSTAHSRTTFYPIIIDWILRCIHSTAAIAAVLVAMIPVSTWSVRATTRPHFYI